MTTFVFSRLRVRRSPSTCSCGLADQPSADEDPNADPPSTATDTPRAAPPRPVRVAGLIGLLLAGATLTVFLDSHVGTSAWHRVTARIRHGFIRTAREPSRAQWITRTAQPITRDIAAHDQRPERQQRDRGGSRGPRLCPPIVPRLGKASSALANRSLDAAGTPCLQALYRDRSTAIEP
jgi:hypothetical protein